MKIQTKTQKYGLKEVVIGAGLALGATGITLGLIGCNGQEKPKTGLENKVETKCVSEDTQKSREYREFMYQEFKESYNLIDLSNLSKEEAKWLNEINKKEFINNFKCEKDSIGKDLITKIINMNNPNDRDCLFIYAHQEGYREFKEMYDSVDLSNLSEKDREWLNGLTKEDKKEFIKDLGPFLYLLHSSTCNLDNPNDKDLLFAKEFKEWVAIIVGSYMSE